MNIKKIKISKFFWLVCTTIILLQLFFIIKTFYLDYKKGEKNITQTASISTVSKYDFEEAKFFDIEQILEMRSRFVTEDNSELKNPFADY